MGFLLERFCATSGLFSDEYFHNDNYFPGVDNILGEMATNNNTTNGPYSLSPQKSVRLSSPRKINLLHWECVTYHLSPF
jgi:hypothetical protein